MKVLDDAFAKAKRKREELKQLYERRRKEVLDQIADLRTDIDENMSRLHRELKEFAGEWMATLEVGDRGYCGRWGDGPPGEAESHRVFLKI